MPDAPDPNATTGGDDAPAPPAPAALADRYALGDEIARGGMGAVFRATDTTLGREVAVKVLQEKFAPDSGTARRFADEAHIAAQLQHPGIPPVHDYGTLPDGRPFLAMKLIKGDTLDDLLKQRPDPAADRGRFVATFEAVCQAVAYAHANGVIHRDLKPANVMVGKFGEVQVMDWGLAKVLASGGRQPPESAATDPDATTGGTEVRSLRDSDDQFTQAGSVLGTPAYMPPEQAVGAVGKVDARSDVFGLGAVLAVILTGKPPFTGTSAETTRVKAATGDVADCLARLDACGAEPELVALCKRCLSARPADRPADAGEVATAVAAFRHAAEARARQAELDRVKAEGERATAEATAAEQRKRRRVQLALAGAVALLVAAGGAFAWWQERQESDRRTERVQRDAERDTRRGQTAASVSAALADARTRAEEAWGRADEPARMRTAADFAVAAVRRAEGFVAAGEATPEALADLAAVQAAVAELDRHARLFRSAELVLEEHGLEGSGEDQKRTAGRLAELFREFGWSTDRTPPEAVAEAVAASRVRNQVLGFLGEWYWNGKAPWVQSALELSRRRAGGVLARWQDLRDRKDHAGLAEFAASPEALEIGPEQICQLGHDFDVPRQPGVRIALLRRAADRYPRHVWVRYDLMLACRDHTPALNSEAVHHAAALATLRPDSGWFQAELCASLKAIGATDPAEAAFRRAMAALSGNPKHLVWLATTLRGKGDAARAVVCAREAIRRDPAAAPAHNALGYALYSSGKRDEAFDAYREAVRLDPGYASARNNLAITLKDRGDLDGAVAELREAVRLDPGNAQYRNNLGVYFYFKRDFAAAVPEMREAVRLDPENTSHRVNLRAALEQLGDLAGALAEAREVIRLDPTNSNRHGELGAILVKAGDLNAAAAAYAEAVRLNPRNAAPATQLGDVYRRLGRHADAVAAYQAALTASPNYAPARTGLDQSLLELRGDIPVAPPPRAVERR